MTITAASLAVEFGADTRDLEAGAAKAQGLVRGMLSTAGGVLGASVFTSLTSHVKGLGASLLTSNANAESLRQSLDIAAGSAAAGGRIFDELRRMAAATPFEFPELVDAATQLQSLGVEALDYIDTPATSPPAPARASTR